MFKKTLIFGIVLGFAGSSFAEGTETEGVQAIEPVFVLEYKFDEPVVDVIFDSATMTVKEAMALGVKGLEKRRASEKVKVQYPRAVFIPQEIGFRKEETRKKEIRFYDKKSMVVKKIEIDREKGEEWGVITSPNKKYILVSRSPDEFNPDIMGGTLYKSDGSLVWRKDEGPFPVAVSDEGYVVAASLQTEGFPPRDFIFYDPKGNEKGGKIVNPYSDSMGESSVIFIDNEYVLFALSAYNKTRIILTTKNGGILWSKEFDYLLFKFKEFDAKKDIGIVGIGEITKRTGLSPNEPGYDPHRDYYVHEYYACFVDWNGNLKWTVPLERKGDMIVKLASDNKKVFIVSSSGYVWCIDISTGKMLWKHKEDWTSYIETAEKKFLLKDKDKEGWKNYVISPDRYTLKLLPYFFEVEITNKYIYIIGKYLKWAGEDARVWRNSRLYILNPQNGNLIQKIEYPNKRITFISQDNNLFLLDIDAKNLLFFETKEVSK